jgi:predicted transposase/invertase (TIGR01784 family)
LKNIAVLGFPEKYKEVIGKVIDESNPKEARKMVSNLSETLKKAYDDAVITGEVKGIEKGIEQGIEKGIEKGITKGMEQAKKEIVLNMLSKNMDKKIISDITGLSVDGVKAIKQTNLDKIH